MLGETTLLSYTDIAIISTSDEADKGVFSKTLLKGLSDADTDNLSSDAFWSGARVTTTHDADNRFIYDTTAGYLYYDADGNGSGSAAVLVAMLGATAQLEFNDLQIIG
jgi:hypothetical protein